MKQMRRLAAVVLMLTVLAGSVPAYASIQPGIYDTEFFTNQEELISAGNVTMKAGEQRDLTGYLIYHNREKETELIGEVIWSSDRADVVSITSRGMATAHRQGHARITATYGDNKGNRITRTMRVTVDDGTSLAPPSWSGQYYFTIVEGQKLNLKELFPPSAGGQVFWSTDHSDLITLSDTGLVHAKRYGTAQVNVTHTDAQGNSETGRVTIRVDSVNLTVHQKTIALTLPKGGTLDMSALMYPDGIPMGQILTLETDDSSMVSVHAHSITARSTGSCYITLVEEAKENVTGETKRQRIQIAVTES